MADAVAAAAQIPAAAVRRAAMLGGDLPDGRRRGAERRNGGIGRVHPAGRPARRPDAGADRGGRRRSAGKARRHSGFRGEAGRRPGADPSRRRPGQRLHPQPRRRHRPTTRGGRGDAGAAGARVDRRRRGDRAASGRPAAALPGHRRRASAAPSTWRPPAPRNRCRSSSSTSCTATASTCSTRRPASGAAALDEIAPPQNRVDRLVTSDPVAAARLSGRDAGRRPRGRDGQVADRALRSRPARRRLAEGQTRAHPRSGGAGRRVGLGAAAAASCPTSTSAPATRPPAAT